MVEVAHTQHDLDNEEMIEAMVGWRWPGMKLHIAIGGFFMPLPLL
jgi:hypothetical protein